MPFRHRDTVHESRYLLMHLEVLTKHVSALERSIRDQAVKGASYPRADVDSYFSARSRASRASPRSQHSRIACPSTAILGEICRFSISNIIGSIWSRLLSCIAAWQRHWRVVSDSRTVRGSWLKRLERVAGWLRVNCIMSNGTEFKA